MKRLVVVLSFVILSIPVHAGNTAAGDIAARKEIIKVSAVGDIMMGTTFPDPKAYLSPGDGAELLKPMFKAIRWGDIRFGNLEGPLIDGGRTEKCGKSGNCYAFRSPVRYAKYLKEAGFTVMSIANNHAMDFGEEGWKSSQDALDAQGIKWSGPKGTYAIMEVRGRKIVLAAFHTADHCNDVRDIQGAYSFIKRLSKKFDLVIVSFHGGAEGSSADRVRDEEEFLGNEDRGNVVQFAHRVVDAGADLVLGSGPHVLRAMEVYRGRLIVYSLGNFCTYGRFNLHGKMGVSMVLQAALSGDGGFVRAMVVPVVQKGRGGPVPDPGARAVAELQKLTDLDFPYTGPVVKDNGEVVTGETSGYGFFTMPSLEQREALKLLLKDLEKKGRGKLKRADLAKWFGDKRAGFLDGVIRKLTKPAEKRFTYKKYRALFITKERIAEGRTFLKAHLDLLKEAERKYNVDYPALAAVVAVETRFGRHKGTYRAFNSLASIALGYPRRSAWAKRELFNLLLMYRDQDPLEPVGSYAGAIGYPQFMPSSIRRFGVDADRDGKVDLSTWPDAVMSCANYLKKYGWQKGGPLKRGSKNYRAVLKYNPSHHYAGVVAELAHIFGYKD
ncbi:MAG: hypothetical protein GXP49_13500 [Deltaproteobacteria bacterium]|nr:hypothetical protein [Deltaproteobacteria bacterium]